MLLPLTGDAGVRPAKHQTVFLYFGFPAPADGCASASIWLVKIPYCAATGWLGLGNPSCIPLPGVYLSINF